MRAWESLTGERVVYRSFFVLKKDASYTYKPIRHLGHENGQALMKVKMHHNALRPSLGIPVLYKERQLTTGYEAVAARQ